MRRKAIYTAAVIAILMISRPLFAHHAPTMFDMTRTVTITGTVAAWEFVNPHVRIQVDAKDEQGNTVRWNIQCDAPPKILRYGWNASSLKVGDRVTIPFRTFTWAQKVLAPADGLFVVPPSIDAKTASMLNINPTTAVLL